MKFKLRLLAAAALFLPPLFWLSQGCNQKLPPVSASQYSPACPPFIFNGFENLTENGQINAPTSGVTYNSTLSLYPGNNTQGGHSLDISIFNDPGWNDHIFILTGFSPVTWTYVTKLVLDLTVDPSVVANSSYAQLEMRADSSAIRQTPTPTPGQSPTPNIYGTYYQSISSDTPALVAGSQSVTFNINYSAGLLQPGDSLNKLTFIYNNNANPGKGNIYVDNMRLYYPDNNCPPTFTPTPIPVSPTPTPTPLYTWNFDDGTTDGWVTTGTGNITGTVISDAAPGYGGSAYCINLLAPFDSTGATTSTFQAAGIAYFPTSPINISGRGIRCQMWMDNGTISGPSISPGGQIIPSDGTNTDYTLYVGLTQGAWTLVDYPASKFASGSVNTGNITSIVVKAGSGNWKPGQTWITGNVKIDDIVIY